MGDPGPASLSLGVGGGGVGQSGEGEHALLDTVHTINIFIIFAKNQRKGWNTCKSTNKKSGAIWFF